MKIIYVLMALFLLGGCDVKQAPLDANGMTPEQVMLETYTLILNKEYDAAKLNYSTALLKELKLQNDTAFINQFYNSKGIDVTEWKLEWLKTELMGNDYNDDVWRVGLIVDQGKGADNLPGVVADFHLIEGMWKMVFWGHYPKSK